ncbi:bifunctional 4-hydroxy-2-oxoglutarate aldolase/2-dehydro-3-deoxy-phosphogluconate aldolase [Pseudochelatococcus sp. G4_1912]|uniref:bifunctional 4-hydroxy-2-oxoglutarate aldolase/2-dehydro-3-deoxy-phosphogluconate aldolase n=1 Tax=Pseudochelatococcus sp. G4_1912 TaxID=3114288 RepID=UPI0039C5D0BF
MQQVHLDRIRACGVIPVVTISDVKAAVPLAETLLEGGIDVVELTLRTDEGLSAIRAVARSVPGILVAAGTVVHPDQVKAVRDAGASLAFSPGFSETLHEAMVRESLDWLPGTATASDVMRAVASGHRAVKFFPAELAGGVPALNALHGPFPDVSFCPTGGVGPHNLAAYLAVPHVIAVGGSWLVSPKALQTHDWLAIREEARETRAAVDAARGVR